MKIPLMAYGYPTILKNVVSEQLNKYGSEFDVKAVLKKTEQEYYAILKRSFEFGGNKNLFMSSYLMGAYLVALYKNTREHLNLDQMDEIIASGLRNFKYMKRQMQKTDLLSMEYKDKVMKAGQWCRENADKYPDNWQVSVRQADNPELTNVVFTNCGLCALCRNEGVPEFISSLCATDYITMSFANCKLERPTTLGHGDDCCNFLITRA